MAGRPNTPQQGNFTATAALLALAGWFAAPALAAPNHDFLCDDPASATLEINPRELVAISVSHGPGDRAAAPDDALDDTHLLRTRVKATAREVFADEDSEAGTEDSTDAPAENTVTGKPRLRPLTDGTLVPFRRQMYRRDI